LLISLLITQLLTFVLDGRRSPATTVMRSPASRWQTRDERPFLANLDILETSIGVRFMRHFTTGDLNKQVGDVTDAASREPVVLTKHRKPRFVLMSYDHYERLRMGGDTRKVHRAAEMPAEHTDLFEAEIGRLARGEGYGDEP
jgi:prevent-host-death family protein